MSIRIVCFHPSLSAYPAFAVLLEILQAQAGADVTVDRRELTLERLRVPPSAPEGLAAASGLPDLTIHCIAADGVGDPPALAAQAGPAGPALAAFDGCAAGQIQRIVLDRFDDYVTSPFRDQEVWPRVLRQTRLAAAPDETLVEQLRNRLGTRHLLGRSPVLLHQLRRIPAVARTDLTVLITGETGTGKELCARAVHVLSRRLEGPFVPVNCATLPVGLVQSELFGHERGAYTGAAASRKGLVRQAEGGTLFLDEVESLDLRSQAALLRFLQERELRPVGGDAMSRADVRIVAAANVDLESAVAGGQFRRDLFYRLNEATLSMPPLRDRGDDIETLTQHFIGKFAAELGSPARGISTEALRKLRTYPWPGNVRELENVVRQALLFTQHAILRPADVTLPGAVAAPESVSFRSMKAKVVADFERRFVARQLAEHEGNLTRAARACGKHPRAFRELVRRYGI